MAEKINYQRIFSLAILVLTFIFLAYYISKNLGSFSSLRLVDPFLIIILMILLLFNYLLLSIVTKYLLTALNINISIFESYSLSIMTGFYNLITPFRGGMFARAFYLKKNHNFPISDFFATLSASYILTFLVSSILGMLSTVAIFLKEGIFSLMIFLIFLSSFIILSMIVIFSPKFKETKYGFINKFITVLNGWHLVRNNAKIILITTLLSLCFNLINAYMLYLQFQVFGIPVSFASALFLVSISSFSILITITPAGLGISEAITIFSALTLSITPSETLPALILGRAVSFILLLIAGPIFSYILFRKKAKKHL